VATDRDNGMPALSPAAAKRLAELIALLDPLGKAVVRASGRAKGGPTNTQLSPLPARRIRPCQSSRDLRLPPPGSVLSRWYQGNEVSVRVFERGFEWDGQRYRSLSAIARRVTGAHWNGLLFFGIVQQDRKPVVSRRPEP